MTENNQNNQVTPFTKVKKEWIAPALIEEDIDATKSGPGLTRPSEGISYHS